MATCLAGVPATGSSFFRTSVAVQGQAAPSTSESSAQTSFTGLQARKRSAPRLGLNSSFLAPLAPGISYGRSRSSIRHRHRSATVALFGGHVKVSEIRSPQDLIDQSAHVTQDVGNAVRKVFESASGKEPVMIAQEAAASLQDVGGRLASILHVDELSNTVAGPVSSLRAFASSLPPLDLPHPTFLQTVGLTALGTVLTTAALSNAYRMKSGVELPERYNPKAIAAYFEQRPVDVMLRSASILSQVSVLVGAIYIDIQSGKKELNEPLRARQCRELITKLGPTAIKVGQALSIRPDLLPLAYLEELQTLQDRVPPFSDEAARKLIEEGLGYPAETLFSELSPEPVAAASLGQVYKGKLRATGETVAVKVQRPGVLEEISRDLYVLRILAAAAMNLKIANSDLVAVLDNWAGRFFDELDYVQEGRNAIRFERDMAALANVTVPKVFPEYTSRRVLTTAWVEGEKLSESRAVDVGPLVTTMLNCYLIQLLESGFLHADPHPGNLLRTPDGKLCVLDFGLMTEVTVDQRYALIEYISHLVNNDYEAVAGDLVHLGFVPPEMDDPESVASIVEPLSKVLGELVKGGGAAKLNINQVTDDLSRMSEKIQFVIPPYFALILRAFGVLEGIGLAADPDYAIVEECYPYLAKRLLTDDSPRARRALRYFLYGRSAQLNVERVEEISAGFQTFRALMLPVGPPTTAEQRKEAATRICSTFRALMLPVGPPTTAAEQRKKAAVVDPAAREALNVVFAPQGSFVQDLLLQELVRATDALSRGAIAEFWLRVAVPASLPGAVLANRLGLPVPRVPEPGTWPLPLPGYLFGSNSSVPTAGLTAEDLKALSTSKRLWALLQPTLQEERSPRETAQFAREVWPVVNELLPGVRYATRKFARMLFERQAARLAADLEAATRSPVARLGDSGNGTLRSGRALGTGTGPATSLTNVTTDVAVVGGTGLFSGATGAGRIRVIQFTPTSIPIRLAFSF
ncbi:Putative protein kinase superfamily protein [Klebsormidium nitens]|uniref:Protein kinase domain-containing protein n=1 Tax=Klebsormidium nitens TaxID=105231 RepID=A0A0U9HJ65_KLENI|nr:Putative protein kinase superfamily protein [Klebsormidium nitens]|eukprot:GAQ81957.1 Putative protein kinase superfamily protein [Klebsormidium nitens]